MDIIVIKRELEEIDKHGSRKDVYEFLRNIWSKKKEAAIAFLVLDEMVDMLLWIESTAKDVQKNEYELYKCFFDEVLEFGYKNCLNNKLFLWQMAYFCHGGGTYYYIFDTSFCQGCKYDEAYERLIQMANQQFPGSMMFKLIPDIQSGYNWMNEISDVERRQLHDELQELHLQNNYSDYHIKSHFKMTELETTV